MDLCVMLYRADYPGETPDSRVQLPHEDLVSGRLGGEAPPVQRDGGHPHRDCRHAHRDHSATIRSQPGRRTKLAPTTVTTSVTTFGLSLPVLPIVVSHYECCQIQSLTSRGANLNLSPELPSYLNTRSANLFVFVV